MIPDPETREQLYLELDELLKQYKVEEVVKKEEDVETPETTETSMIPIIVGFMGGVGMVLVVLLIRRWCLLRRTSSTPPSSRFSIAE